MFARAFFVCFLLLLQALAVKTCQIFAYIVNVMVNVRVWSFQYKTAAKILLTSYF